MTGTWYTDLQHFLDENGQMANASARKAGRFFALIAESGSRMAPGAEQLTGIPCVIPGRRKACSGALALIREATGESIEWYCVSCGATGVLTGWTGTEWDLGPRPERGRDPEQGRGDGNALIEIALQPELIWTLRCAPQLSDRALRTILADAQVDDEYDLIFATKAESRLLRDACRAAGNAARGDRRRVLDHITGRLEGVIAAYRDRTDYHDLLQRKPLDRYTKGLLRLAERLAANHDRPVPGESDIAEAERLLLEMPQLIKH